MSIWILMMLIMVASLLVQSTLQRRFDKYAKVPSAGGLSGAEVARKMLLENGITDVKVVSIPGRLTDHYNPTDKTLNLSQDVYAGRHVAACAVAAHETGHAIQHATAYAPLRMRSAMVPVVTFANNTVQWVLLAGIIFIKSFPSLIWVGIGLFALTTLFSFITLPVEVDASRRAVRWLEGAGIVQGESRSMASDALHWAAYTYVIAAIGSLATLLYYITVANSRR